MFKETIVALYPIRQKVEITKHSVQFIYSTETLDGPSDKIEVNTTLEYNGYNYILLYAHNEGSIAPNTAAIRIDDGVSTEDFTLQSNLSTNGAVDLIID